MVEWEHKMLKIKVNEDKEVVRQILDALSTNGYYCPCRLEKNGDTKCMCKEFREQETPGYCHCGLYYKVEE